jgi:hypothetical protein
MKTGELICKNCKLCFASEREKKINLSYENEIKLN